jgi:antibiotic biosynthesis monooxygenase (ABM) superfamily enzyme
MASQRRKPTVIVARRPSPGREREFERWLRRLVAKAADARGYVDADIQPPNALHPDEWVIVYRFADGASLDAWLRSPTRTALLADGNELVDGSAREQVVALSPTSDRVTAVSSVRVRPDSVDAYRELHDQVLAELVTLPGFLRCDLFEPVDGVQDETVVVLAFDSRANLDRWLTSDTRRDFLARMDELIEGDRTINVVGGFGGWFAPTGSPHVKPWKSAVAVLLALVPTTLAFAWLREMFFQGIALVPGVLLGNIFGVAILTWVLMPFITSRLEHWLRR